MVSVGPDAFVTSTSSRVAAPSSTARVYGKDAGKPVVAATVMVVEPAEMPLASVVGSAVEE
jgi:hypothetical protein